MADGSMSGFTDDKFAGVAEAFEGNLANGADVGASFCATVEGETVVKEIATLHAQGRPVLVGTISVETSEMLSRMLKKEGLIHSVLNAKYHQQEAEIVSRAGQRGSITIATNASSQGLDNTGDIVLKTGSAANCNVRCSRLGSASSAISFECSLRADQAV